MLKIAQRRVRANLHLVALVHDPELFVEAWEDILNPVFYRHLKRC